MSHLFQNFRIFAISLALGLVSVTFLQGVALSIHQGQHSAHSAKADANAPTLDNDGCSFCTALIQPKDTPTPSIDFADFIPFVSKSTFVSPVDPKSNIQRTCDARGPPALSLS